jgi:hypothetical protein
MDGGDPLQPKGEDSPDYPENVFSQAIRGFIPLLVDVISNQESVDQLARDLYSQCLIENTIFCELRVQGRTEEEKAHRVLEAVMSKLRTCPTKEPFEHFISVLESYHSCCDIVGQIKTKYQQLQKSSEATKEKQALIARRQILQLNKEVITLKKHPMACAGACEHKSKCEKLKKQNLIEKLKEEKLDYTAKIESLTQQIDMLLSDDCIFND